MKQRTITEKSMKNRMTITFNADDMFDDERVEMESQLIEMLGKYSWGFDSSGCDLRKGKNRKRTLVFTRT